MFAIAQKIRPNGLIGLSEVAIHFFSKLSGSKMVHFVVTPSYAGAFKIPDICPIEVRMLMQ